MTTKILIVQGCSLHGKSSFMSHIIGKDSQSVGANSGPPSTKGYQTSLGSDWLRLWEGNQNLCIFEVPDFEDTQRDQQAAASIWLISAKKTGYVDAIFVVQSLAESPIKLKSQFTRAEAMYGPEAMKSVILIITKSNITPQEDADSRLRAINRQCEENNIPWVMWTGSSSERGQVAVDTNHVAALRTAVGYIRPVEIAANETEPMAEGAPESQEPEETPRLPQQFEPSFVPIKQQRLSDSEVQDQNRRFQAQLKQGTPKKQLKTEMRTVTTRYWFLCWFPWLTVTTEVSTKRPAGGNPVCPHKCPRLQGSTSMGKVAGNEPDGTSERTILRGGRASSLARK